MNIANITDARNRVRALHAGLIRLDALTALYRGERLTIADSLEIKLSTAQRFKVLNRALTLTTRLRAYAAALPVPTGHTGTPNPKAVAEAERNPPHALESIANLATQQLEPLTQITMTDREDGTFDFDFDDADTHAVADALATAGAQATVLIGVMATRLPEWMKGRP